MSIIPSPSKIPSSDTRRECLLRISAMAGASAALQACGSTGGEEPPARKEPARLEISISAENDMNAGIKGDGAPLLLRIYELKSDAIFLDADFFALQDHDKTLLGSELLAFDQFMLRPGETRNIRRQALANTTTLGFFAGYRDLPQSIWRLSHTLPAAPTAHWYRAVVPASKARLSLRLTRQALLLADADARPAVAPLVHTVESAESAASPSPAASAASAVPMVKPGARPPAFRPGGPRS